MSAPAVAGTARLADRVVACLRAYDVDGLAALYRADVLFDASVPYWRYQLQGRDAVAEQMREELAAAGGAARVTGVRATPTGEGVVVELEARFDAEDGERLWREVHVVRTDGEAVVEHAVYCTGVWDAATIARHAVEAPMVGR